MQAIKEHDELLRDIDRLATQIDEYKITHQGPIYIPIIRQVQAKTFFEQMDDEIRYGRAMKAVKDNE